MAAVLPLEVFLSHSSQDRQFATDLASVVRRHGIPVWYSQTNIVGAQQWQDEIGAALRRCDWFALILSPQSAASMWVKRELSYALQQNRFENRIVPIVYQSSNFEQLSWTLSLFQMVNFTPVLDDGYRDLLRIWGLGYQSE
jgi:TIR domain-containing protein